MTPETFDFPEIMLDRMKDPYGIAINSLGNLYVTDAGNGRVLVFDNAGNLISTWDKQGSVDGEFKSMGFGGLVIDSKDNVFVVDKGNFRYLLGRIQIFDNDGNFTSAIGGKSITNNPFKRPSGIVFDSNRKIYVVNQFGNSISML